jgi:hypothetical protein
MQENQRQNACLNCKGHTAARRRMWSAPFSSIHAATPWVVPKSVLSNATLGPQAAKNLQIVPK